RQAQSAGVQVHPLAKVGDVLRSLVGDARDIVLEDQHGRGVAAVEGQFLYVDDGAIGDAAHSVEPCTALAFEFLGGFGLAAQQKIEAEGDGRATQYKTIDTKRIHDLNGRGLPNTTA